MSKIKLPATALLLLALVGSAPLTASAPLSASAATAATQTSYVKVQTMNVKMIFDGVSIQPPAGQYAFIYNNSTYVPLRFMSYALQKSVSWDAKNVRVTVADPSSSELVVIKEYLMNLGSNASTAKNITLTKVNASYIFDGTNKKLPAGQSSFIMNGTLYVPLRFFSESVGHTIGWDQKTKTVTATSASYQGSEDNSGTTTPGGTGSATATPAPGAGGGSTSANPTYEQITSETEAKLTALQAQSRSALTVLALDYLSATDAATKSSLLSQGKQQLASFTASFNSIIADAEAKLTKYGYSTEIISQYRATFEAELQKGMSIAEGMNN
ncbi:copper amine oxidase N-terminal domain-containing protein [Paenibacillus tepidiphilus]|uniref:copper amine oxidase N-terminal domain-containing protein n=1 Tax=Paenibacillus tepidiphilus TaxID=2608683 RepID=UPI0013A54E43|nr:copper amine oxidase N-terminal domain-containing protein [Paenibacillus tepidiphilus]